MRGFYCDHFELPLPPGHRFPMAKYRLLREAVAREGLAELRVPPAVTDEQILRVHTAEYLEHVKAGTLDARDVRRIGFPWSAELVERSRRSAGGTLAAARAALEDGSAVNLAGGTHHAFPDHGEGFCVFNDVAIAARDLLDERPRRILVFDCDVHQGNGTAAIFAGEPLVFTVSIHGRRNFPFRKQTSDLDLELDDGTGDDAYLDLLDGALERAFSRFDADVVFYVAGADPYRDDRLGRLALTRRGLAARDERVLTACREHGTPVAVVMAGGYATDVERIVAIHLETIRHAASLATTSATACGELSG